MTKNNLKMLGQDEIMREYFEEVHKDILSFCKQYNLTLDMASSDVSLFLIDAHGEAVELWDKN